MNRHNFVFHYAIRDLPIVSTIKANIYSNRSDRIHRAVVAIIRDLKYSCKIFSADRRWLHSFVVRVTKIGVRASYVTFTYRIDANTSTWVQYILCYDIGIRSLYRKCPREHDLNSFSSEWRHRRSVSANSKRHVTINHINRKSRTITNEKKNIVRSPRQYRSVLWNGAKLKYLYSIPSP